MEKARRRCQRKQQKLTHTHTPHSKDDGVEHGAEDLHDVVLHELLDGGLEVLLGVELADLLELALLGVGLLVLGTFRTAG